jgi:hypothetical protein
LLHDGDAEGGGRSLSPIPPSRTSFDDDDAVLAKEAAQYLVEGERPSTYRKAGLALAVILVLALTFISGRATAPAIPVPSVRAARTSRDSVC